LNASDAGDFAQETWVHLLENDGERLRRFGGRSAAETYFVRVATNVLIGIGRRRDGHWRPSVRAGRLGVVALELETLVARDRLTPHEAIETLHARRGVTRAELECVLSQLEDSGDHRARPLVASGRQMIDFQGQQFTPTNPEWQLIERELTGPAIHAAVIIVRAWRLLTVEEQLSLAKRFAGTALRDSSHLGHSAPASAVREALRHLRELLASAGVQWHEASLALGKRGLDLGLQEIAGHKRNQVSEPTIAAAKRTKRQDKTSELSL
jgi:hypothetical protein